MNLLNYQSYGSVKRKRQSNIERQEKILHANYVDAIEAVHGWLNSPAHRNVLLDKDFTHLGTGAYGKYYTQNLIRMNIEEKKHLRLILQCSMELSMYPFQFQRCL